MATKKETEKVEEVVKPTEKTAGQQVGGISAEEFYAKKEAEINQRETELEAREKELDKRQNLLDEREAKLKASEEKEPAKPKVEKPVEFTFQGSNYRFTDAAPKSIRIDGVVKTQQEIASDEDDLLQLVAGGSGLIERIV